MRCRFFLASIQTREPGVLPFQRMRFFSATDSVYFFRQSRAQRSFGCFSHLHQIFALRILFMMLGSLSPRPPCSLGLQIFAQLTSAIFFSVLMPCHRKFRCKFLMVVCTKVRGGQDQENVGGESLKNFSEENELAGEIESSKGPGREIFGEGGEQVFPGGVSKGVVD
jgi:hypothetical protein